MTRIPVSAPGLSRLIAAASAILLLAGCQAETPAGNSARPVAVFTVEASRLSDAVQLTGDIQAQKDVDAAFRIAGKMTERPVNVGDTVKAGQVLARLDSATEQNALQAAKAALTAARGEVATARNTFDRQQHLMNQGFTTRPRFDQARQALETAQSRLEDAEARSDAARDRLGFTELVADAPGVVTARGAEPGEVIQPGRMIVRLARGDGRDAVFEVPAAMLRAGNTTTTVDVSLAGDPAVTAVGRIREVSPEADPVTRTFRVRVGLDTPPEAMRLGATIIGTVALASNVITAIPALALTSDRGAPAVWVIDPASSTVALRPVDVLRFDTDRVILAQGLEPGDVIVAAGVQALFPGQRVRPLAPRKLATQTTTRNAEGGPLPGRTKG